VSAQQSSELSEAGVRRGFCIYVDTLCQGPTPAVRDEDGWPCVFETENAAHREIVDSLLIRLRQFTDGEREFHDAVMIDEFVVPVRILTDGSIVDEDGRHFGSE
jgi:hypothetical protein